MVFLSLADFLETLSGAGELQRVTDEVSPDLEIAQRTRQAAEAGGPALLFERVRGQRGVVVTNLFGSQSRICRALGVESLDAFQERGERLAEATGRGSWLDRLKTRSEPAGLEKFEPKLTKLAACQQVVRLASDVDLAQLPILRCWPVETSPTITAGQLLAREEATGRRIWTTAPLTVVDRNHLAVALDPLHPLWPAFQAAQVTGGSLPVAIVVGGSPLAMLLGSLPRVTDLDPWVLAGKWNDQPLSIVPARTQPLEVPADAEMVLEGVLDPSAPALEGGATVLPLGLAVETNGWRTIEITAITHRTNAGYLATVPSPPPSEATQIDRVAERLLLTAAQRVAPEVIDLSLPSFGGRHNYVFVAIRKQYAHQAQQVAGALWGLESLRLTKTLVLVDEGVDVHNVEQVLFHLGLNLLPGRDVFLRNGPLDPHDRNGAADTWAAKLGIDATSKSHGEGPAVWPALVDARRESG